MNASSGDALTSVQRDEEQLAANSNSIAAAIAACKFLEDMELFMFMINHEQMQLWVLIN